MIDPTESGVRVTGMGRQHAPEIEAAARHIVDEGLRKDGSAFTPERQIWTSAHANELIVHFVDNPEVSGGDFMERLKRQLEPVSPGAIQLVAELLYLNLLPLADYNSSTKRRVINDVLAWVPGEVRIPPDLDEALDYSLFRGGVAFKTGRWQQLSFLVQFVARWKRLREEQQQLFLADPWAFKDYLAAEPTPRVPAQRNELKWMLFPQFFEPIVSVAHKKKIRNAFGDLIDKPTGDIDRDLLAIHQALEEEHEGPIDLYLPPFGPRWKAGQEDEVPDTAAEASEAQRAWLIRGSNVQGLNLVSLWLEDAFCSLSASHLRPVDPDISRDELRAAVESDYSHVSYNARTDKLNEFHAFLSRMQTGDYVLTTSEGRIYVGVVTGEPVYEATADGRSNLRRTVAWRNTDDPVDFSQLPDPLPARLSIQHDVVDLTQELRVIETMLGEPVPSEPLEATLPDATDNLAANLLLDRPWLQESIDLLRDMRQLIYYGPPGTGKTFIAQHLARHVGGPENVTLVQFHPAYSYEDFFEGFRPQEAGGGSGVTFALQSGPFRRLVDQAREHPSQPHVLIIDEINRANIAKVFGELYFLLEYRDEAIDLLYSPGEQGFTMPKNVYLIGTMNTADRSIALVDSAMRRRFAFVALHPSQEPVAGLLGRWLAREGLPDVAARLLAVLNERIDDPDFKIGPSYLMRRSIYEVESGFERVWRTAVMPLLQEHHYGQNIDLESRYGLAALRQSIEAE